jgi:riboflavin kinase / FMN adenylyltransferase
VRVVSSPDALELPGSVVAIGNFDGVHLGHQLLLEHLHAESRETGLPGVILTFFPPSKVLFQGTKFLADADEKAGLLAAYDPAAIVIVPFDHAYAQTPKDVFLTQLARLNPHTLIVGEDFRFGHKREGTLNDLSHLPERLEVFALRKLDGDPVSSSRIRKHLEAGEVAAAARLLGRPYSARGRVVRGDRRGRTIGYPTANVATPEGKALPLGVFAVRVETDADVYPGMANVGPRPSFPDGAPSLEAHLFDFAGDLYGQTVQVHFLAYLRGQQRFAGIEALKARLEEDERAARTALEID